MTGPWRFLPILAMALVAGDTALAQVPVAGKVPSIVGPPGQLPQPTPARPKQDDKSSRLPEGKAPPEGKAHHDEFERDSGVVRIIDLCGKEPKPEWCSSEAKSSKIRK